MNAAQIVGGSRPARHDHARSGGARRRRLHPAGDPRRARPERRPVPRRRDHRGRPDAHGADRLEDHLGRRDRRTSARAVGLPRSSQSGAVTIADVADRRAEPGSGDDDLARQRRARPDDRGHEAPVRQHRRRVARRARRPARPRRQPRRRRVHRRLRPGALHPGVDRHAREGGPARPVLRRARDPRLPDVGARDARHGDLDPDERADHLHRHPGVRLLAEHPHPRRAHDRDRTRRRRLDRRDREHQAPLRRRRRQAALDPARGARGRLRDHGVDHHDRRGVPADRLRRRRHRRAVPAVRADRDDRDDRIAVRGADDRAGAGLLVPAPGQAAPRRAGSPDRPGGSRMPRPAACRSRTCRSCAGR